MSWLSLVVDYSDDVVTGVHYGQPRGPIRMGYPFESEVTEHDRTIALENCGSQAARMTILSIIVWTKCDVGR
jgi:hypothetical protein